MFLARAQARPPCSPRGASQVASLEESLAVLEAKQEEGDRELAETQRLLAVRACTAAARLHPSHTAGACKCAWQVC
jgi:hypothetical protein